MHIRKKTYAVVHSLDTIFDIMSLRLSIVHSFIYLYLMCTAHHTALHITLHCTSHCTAHHTALHITLHCKSHCTHSSHCAGHDEAQASGKPLQVQLNYKWLVELTVCGDLIGLKDDQPD